MYAMPCDYIYLMALPPPSHFHQPLSSFQLVLSDSHFLSFSFAYVFRYHAGNPTFCVLVMQWRPVSGDGPLHIPPDVNSNDKNRLLG